MKRMLDLANLAQQDADIAMRELIERMKLDKLIMTFPQRKELVKKMATDDVYWVVNFGGKHNQRQTRHHFMDGWRRLGFINDSQNIQLKKLYDETLKSGVEEHKKLSRQYPFLTKRMV